MLHEANQVELEDATEVARRSRLGLRLLSIYVLAYAFFLLVCCLGLNGFGAMTLSGIPVSIWYGFGLMIGAILLAVVYGRLCRLPSGGKEPTR